MNPGNIWKSHETLGLFEGLSSVSKSLIIMEKHQISYKTHYKGNPLLSWSLTMAGQAAFFHLFRHHWEIPHWLQKVILAFLFSYNIGTKINWITLSEKSQLCEFTSLS